MKPLPILLLLFCLGGAAHADSPLELDRTRTRDLRKWKPLITQYSTRHYGEATWRLDPTCMVLHYTATPNFPWNLVESTSFAGETPGLAVHYVIDGDRIWELLPPDVRSRGAYGINHRAINIKMVATDAADLATRTKTLQSCRRLCLYLMKRYAIGKSHVYSHQQVATMSRRVVPEVLDLINSSPYDKTDPGEDNMKTILSGL